MVRVSYSAASSLYGAFEHRFPRPIHFVSQGMGLHEILFAAGPYLEPRWHMVTRYYGCWQLVDYCTTIR